MKRKLRIRKRSENSLFNAGRYVIEEYCGIMVGWLPIGRLRPGKDDRGYIDEYSSLDRNELAYLMDQINRFPRQHVNSGISMREFFRIFSIRVTLLTAVILSIVVFAFK